MKNSLKGFAPHKKRLPFTGFTLVELMVVVICITLVASFGLPNYHKMVRKNHARTMLLNLRAIHGANEVFMARNGDYLQGGPLDITAINAGLSTSFILGHPNITYTYSAGVNTYQADAIWTDGTNDFAISIDENALSGANPWCNLILKPGGDCMVI